MAVYLPPVCSSAVSTHYITQSQHDRFRGPEVTANNTDGLTTSISQEYHNKSISALSLQRSHRTKQKSARKPRPHSCRGVYIKPEGIVEQTPLTLLSAARQTLSDSDRCAHRGPWRSRIKKDLLCSPLLLIDDLKKKGFGERCRQFMKALVLAVLTAVGVKNATEFSAKICI